MLLQLAVAKRFRLSAFVRNGGTTVTLDVEARGYRSHASDEFPGGFGRINLLFF